MAAFRDSALAFIGDLRSSNIRISVAESIDAMRAVAAIGLDQRGRVREALAAALIKDEADRATFDEAFARHFGGADQAAVTAADDAREADAAHRADGDVREAGDIEASSARPACRRAGGDRCRNWQARVRGCFVRWKRGGTGRTRA